MDIRLSPHTEAIVEEEMATGRFRSPEEVIDLAVESFHASVRNSGPTVGRSRLSADQFRDFLNSLVEGSEAIPDTPTSAFSRENIYHDHA